MLSVLFEDMEDHGAAPTQVVRRPLVPVGSDSAAAFNIPSQDARAGTGTAAGYDRQGVIGKPCRSARLLIWTAAKGCKPTLIRVVSGPFSSRSPRGRVGRVETRHRLAADSPGHNVSMRADHAGAGEEGEDQACGRLLSGQLKQLHPKAR